MDGNALNFVILLLCKICMYLIPDLNYAYTTSNTNLCFISTDQEPVRLSVFLEGSDRAKMDHLPEVEII